MPPARRPANPRPTPPDGDTVGAADLTRRIADTLRRHRKARQMSLDELAQASGVSRAALSQIETARTNPSVGVLWKIAVGLGVPFAELLGEERASGTILRRVDTQVLRSPDGRFESRPLTPAGATPWVELYELRLAARSRHPAEPHAEGTREVLVVLSGQLRLTVAGSRYELGPGDSIFFLADQPHAYDNPGSTETRCHNVIVYPR